MKKRTVLLTQDEVGDAIGLWLLKKRTDMKRADTFEVTFVTTLKLNGTREMVARVDIEEHDDDEEKAGREGEGGRAEDST